MEEVGGEVETGGAGLAVPVARGSDAGGGGRLQNDTPMFDLAQCGARAFRERRTVWIESCV